MRKLRLGERTNAVVTTDAARRALHCRALAAKAWRSIMIPTKLDTLVRKAAAAIPILEDEMLVRGSTDMEYTAEMQQK
jgi:hypothetical protein